MNATRTLAPLALLPLVLLATGCGNATPEAPAADPVAAESAAESSAAPAEAPAAEVEFEPAYPAEVSEEGLSEADTAQQAPHAHDGGEAHVHDDEEHAGDAEPHAHDGEAHDDHEH